MTPVLDHHYDHVYSLLLYEISNRMLSTTSNRNRDSKGLLKNKQTNFLIYLAAPGLSCSMWDLPVLLQHANSFVVACGI